MRPIHAGVLVVVVFVVLLGAWFLVGRETQPRPAVPDAATAAEEVAGRAADAALEAPDLDHASRDVSISDASVAAGVPPSTAVQVAPSNSAGSGFLVTGRAVDTLGKPIADALVYADGASGGYEPPLDVLDLEMGPWQRRAEAKTDAQGRFEIRPTATSAVRIAVRASGFAPHDQQSAIAGSRLDLGDLVLEPSVFLTGRVIDTSGRPIAGAKLARLTPGAEALGFFGTSSGALVATTDAGGRFRVDQLAFGPWKILITSDAHPDKVEEGEVERAGTTVSGLEFVLAEGGEIRGRVVRAPADMLKNMWVRAVSRPSESDGGGVPIGGPPTALRRARVQPDGSFVVSGLAKSGSYNLSGRDSEREFLGRRRTAVVQAKVGDVGVELPLQPETAIVCQVVDALTSEPIVDLDVQAGYRWRQPLINEAGTVIRRFPEGRVRFANLQPSSAGETAQVHIESVGYEPFDASALAIVEGQDFDLGLVRLKRSPVVKVLVLEAANGEPVRGAQVTLVEEEPNPDGDVTRMMMSVDDEHEGLMGEGASHRARTGEDGRARVSSFPGRRAHLVVKAQGFAPYTSAPMDLPLGEDVEREAKLGPGGTVIVEVVDSKGRPVPGVGIDRRGPSQNEPMLLDFDGADVTNAEGRVRFEHLEVGVHGFKTRGQDSNAFGFGDRSMVVMRRSGAGLAEEEDEGWSDALVADGSLSTVQIVAPTRSSIAGRVTEMGTALANATLRLSDASSTGPTLPFELAGGMQARTNGKGEYLLENVPIGKYRLSLTHATRSMPHESEIEVKEGENERDIDLTVAIVEGRIRDREEKPLAGVRVRAERARAPGEGRQRVTFATMMVVNDGDDSAVTLSSGDGAGSEAVTDAEGRYRLRGVLPDVDIVVKATGKETQPGESKVFHVAPDQVKSDVDLVLEAGGAIDVQAFRADGRPAASCLVRGRYEAAGGSEAEPKVQVTGANGTAKLTGLKPGKWSLHVQAMGPGSDEAAAPDQVIEVTAGATAAARFEMP